MRHLPALHALGFGVVTLIALSAAPPPGNAESCYEISGQVRELGEGWAHIVVVQNDCEYWLQCTVWTDVDPQPPAMLSVGPGMSESAQITADAEEKEFKAFGTCRRK
jgi:hypothetical protein